MCHKEQLKKRNERNKLIVLGLLDLTELEYGMLIFESGISYLEAILQDDTDSIDMLKTDAMFWSWWENHWNRADHEWIADVEYRRSRQALLREYKELHSVHKLRFYPGKNIFMHAYKAKAEASK